MLVSIRNVPGKFRFEPDGDGWVAVPEPPPVTNYRRFTGSFDDVVTQIKIAHLEKKL